MNKKPVIAAVVVLVAAGGWMLWNASNQPAAPNTLVMHGNVDLRQVSLAFNASERITSIAVQEGERVVAGQVLAELDTRMLALKLAQARAQAGVSEQALKKLKAGSRPEELAQAGAGVAAAQAEADNAVRQAERARALGNDTAGRALSQQDIDNAQARAKVAQAHLQAARKARELVANGARSEDIAQAEAVLEAARAQSALLAQQLAEARLTAPLNAVVQSRLLEPGDMASPQRPVLTLAIVEPKWVRTYVSEVDLGRIRPGMAALVTTDSQPGHALAGRVGSISSVAEFTPKTVQTEELRTTLVYEVRVRVKDDADTLRLGMPATVRVALAPQAGK